MTSVENKTIITLKGSVEIVSEFFFTAINSILYQRGACVLPRQYAVLPRRHYNVYWCQLLETSLSIFFLQRISSGIYEPETFKREAKYGLTVLTTTDDGLLEYLNQVMGQMESWLLDGDVQRLVVVVSGVDSGETLERWQFNVNVDDNHRAIAVGGDENMMQNSTVQVAPKSLKEIHNEIQAIIRQITASVS